jgi:tetratricopeptide (TPR) repeat protein
LIAALAAIIAVAIVGAAGDDPKQTDSPKSTPTATAKKKPKKKATPEPTAEATQAPTQAPATTTADPAKLNDQGFALMNQGKYDQAVPILKQAVDACGDSLSTTCAYATYNYGAALNRSGDPAAAIPVLQRRLERWPDNQADTVRQELAAACEAAGADCGDAGGGPPGKANGHKKPK